MKRQVDLAEGTPKPEWYGEHYEGDVQPIELMQAQFDTEEFAGGSCSISLNMRHGSERKMTLSRTPKRFFGMPNGS